MISLPSQHAVWCQRFQDRLDLKRRGRVALDEGVWRRWGPNSKYEAQRGCTSANWPENCLPLGTCRPHLKILLVVGDSLRRRPGRCWPGDKSLISAAKAYLPIKFEPRAIPPRRNSGSILSSAFSSGACTNPSQRNFDRTTWPLLVDLYESRDGPYGTECRRVVTNQAHNDS